MQGEIQKEQWQSYLDGFSKRNSGRTADLQMALHKNLRIPPTGVGGSFRSHLPETLSTCLRNPTNGSWWIVRIGSTKTCLKILRFLP